MTLPDCSVQAGETPVTEALRRYARLIGARVTSTTGGAHTATSHHYTGRAVDLAEPDRASADSEGLLRINEAIVRTIPLQMITELIYSGPGNICVKAGRIVSGRRDYGLPVMARHHDHVHLAVVERFTYVGTENPVMPDDPNLPNIVGPVELRVLQNDAGECTGYYIFSHATGELHAFGPGTRFYGRSEVVRLVAT